MQEVTSQEEEEEITAVSKLSGGRRKGRGKTRDVLISRQPFLTRPPSPHMVREKEGKRENASGARCDCAV